MGACCVARKEIGRETFDRSIHEQHEEAKEEEEEIEEKFREGVCFCSEISREGRSGIRRRSEDSTLLYGQDSDGTDIRYVNLQLDMIMCV